MHHAFRWLRALNLHPAALRANTFEFLRADCGEDGSLRLLEQLAADYARERRDATASGTDAVWWRSFAELFSKEARA